MRSGVGLVLFAVAIAVACWLWLRAPTKLASPRAADTRGLAYLPTPQELATYREAPCATVTGTVTAAAGVPLRATISQYRSGPWTTDERGAFELCYRWELGDLSFAASGYTTQTVTPTPRKRVIAVVLERTGDISGRVLEEDRDIPVAGVSVLGHITADDGSFEMRGLSAGTHVLGGRGDGWEIQRASVTVVGGEIATVTLRAMRTFPVRGRVLDGEAPLPHATVCVAVPKGLCATTDLEGRFTVDTALRGEYRIGVAGRRVSPTRVELAPDAPELVVRVEPHEEYLATIRGRVTRLGVPVAGVEVGGTSTLSDGTFVLREPPGTITIEAHARELFALGGPITLTLAAGETREVDLELEHEGAIGGVVVNQSGEPVPRALVRVEREDGAEKAAVRSRADGSFYIAPILPGVYRAEVLWVYEPVLFRDLPRPPIAVATSTTQVTGLRFVVDTRVGSISGRMIDAAGRPVAGGLVAADGPPYCGSWTDGTGADGRFAIGDLLVGEHAIVATDCDGHWGTVDRVETGRHDVVVTASGPPPLVAAPPARSVGRVIVHAVDDAGAPLPGIMCGGYRLTDHDGTVALDVYDAHPMYLGCEDPVYRFFRGDRTITARPGATVEVIIPVLLR